MLFCLLELEQNFVSFAYMEYEPLGADLYTPLAQSVAQ